MIGEPRLEDDREQPYIGIRTQVPIRHPGKTIPTLLGERLIGALGRDSGPS